MADSGGGNPGFSYMPQPFEQAYYLGLFNAADTERRGAIGGAQAVQFFSRSKLPVDVLKAVWTVSDNPPTNTLDHRKFAVAIRLIQLAQNGQKGQGPNLAAADGAVLRPVYIDGVSGVSVPLPQESPPSQPESNFQRNSQPEQTHTQTHQNTQQQLPPIPQHQNPQMSQMQQNNIPVGHQQSAGFQEMNTSQSSRFQPNTPPRPPQPVSSNFAAMGGALTAQDPYTLHPNEQARYEQLFAEYAKDDGYCYGPEAVGLFGKSGMPQPQLAAIWNMVDVPVDNRLDKLEFAIAMHLIICVSKKNLPMPMALPLPLKQLKSQMPHPPTNKIPSPALSSQQSPMVGAINDPPAITRIPSPTLSSQPPPMSSMNDMGGFGGNNHGQFSSVNSTDGFRITQNGAAGFKSGMPVGTGSVGSHAGGMGMSGTPPLQSSIQSPTGGASISDAFEGLVTGGGDTESISTYRGPSSQIHVSNSFETNNSELHSLQPSTYENAPAHAPIPSAAPLPKTKTSNRTDDSSSGAEELRAALQKLQAENISLKAKLSTMVGEDDDVRKELMKTVAEITSLSNELTTLRAQVLAAKSRLLEATGELTAANEKKSVIKDLITETKATKIAIEEATKSVEDANAASATQSAPPIASFGGDLFDWGSGDVVSSAPAPVPGSSQGYAEFNTLAPAPVISQGFSGSSTRSYDMGTTSSSFGQPEPTTHVESDRAPPVKYDGPQSSTMPLFNSTDNPKKPDLIRDPSMGFGEVMGGGADLRSFSAGSYDAQSGEEYGDVEDLKKEAKAAKEALREAENVAQDAHENKEQILAQANELRRVYDEAEKIAREATVPPTTGKKKGLFARGHKNDPKEAAKLAADARDKKDAFLQAQSQLNDASSFVDETKKEVERLRKKAEDLDIKAASAASMQKPMPAPVPTVTNGFPSYGFPSPAPPTTTNYASQPFENTTFSSNVMGSGSSKVMGSVGTSIPTPLATDDPYGNPFG